jgi:hypothetical protein
VSDDLTALLGRITAWLDDDSGGSNDQYEQSYALLSEAAAALAAERQAREQAERDRDWWKADRDVERTRAEQAEQERDRLREVLDKFGVHQSGCAIHAGIGCSCGLDAALSPQDGQR